MSDYTYRTNCGQYVLHKGDTPVGPVMDEVALAIDIENWVLHKHGPVAHVEAWANRSREALRASNPQMANALVVLSGRIPLDELNRCLANGSCVEKLYKAAQAGTLTPMPFA